MGIFFSISDEVLDIADFYFFFAEGQFVLYVLKVG